MDTTTMRAFARAPGRTAAQKAGAKQELLSVVREDNVDLPENRVVVWVAQRIRVLASAWVSRYEGLESRMIGNTLRAVRDLNRLAGRVLASREFVTVKPLAHHLDSPTYCLQFDRRYREIWRAYRAIRTQDRRRDDAFRWQGRLWGTTARLLLAALLLDPDGAAWDEADGVSTPYFRGEAEDGEWLEGPSVPGPFRTATGLCHLLDLRPGLSAALPSNASLPSEALESGADQLLVWPEARRVCPVWNVIASDDLGLVVEADRLAERLSNLDQSGIWRWFGLVMQAEPYMSTAKGLQWHDQVGPLHVMHVPEDVHSRWGDLQACIQMICEESLR